VCSVNTNITLFYQETTGLVDMQSWSRDFFFLVFRRIRMWFLVRKEHAVGDLRFVLYIYIFVLFEGHVNSILQHQIMQRTHYLVIPAHEHTRQLNRLKLKKKN
jgi:hypothetical protein